MLLKQSKQFFIEGNLVDAQGDARYGVVRVDNGKIGLISYEVGTIPKDALVFRPGKDCYIYPGLIDLHSHIDYNIFPLWDNRFKYKWDNRFEWRISTEYKTDIDEPLKKIRKNWNNSINSLLGIFDDCSPSAGVVFQLLSELQAITGGTTTLQENTSLESVYEEKNREHILIRNTGTSADMGFPDDQKIESVVDFYNPKLTECKYPPLNTMDWKLHESPSLSEFLETYKTGNIRSILVHLAEGRSGFGLHKKGYDIYSRNESISFLEKIKSLDKQKFDNVHFGLIHGCGFNLLDMHTIQELKDFNVHFIWSPVSNLLLYGDTIFPPLLWEHNSFTCLGSDWSPSGSKHVWDEAKIARYFFNTLGFSVSNLSIYNMVTQNPARLLGIPAGLIKKDYLADFFIIKCKDPLLTPLEAFFSYDDRDTRAVIVAGVPIYGDTDIFDLFGISPQVLSEEMGEYASSKAVNVPNSLLVQIGTDFHKMKRLLNQFMVKNISRPLSSDDKYYQDMIADLKTYILKYAKQLRNLPTDIQSIRRI